ncbi:histidine kinase [Methylocella sp.]|uniref:histidine kinase n=1 Tax=Methylocella sp. TaxID=1978226 RepID=UPI0035AEB809
MARRAARNSILTRLVLIPAAILAFGILAAVAATLAGARARIASEMASGFALGDHLIRYALDDLAAADPAAQKAATARLAEALAQVRHIRVAFVAPDAEAPGPAAAREAAGAPGWFTALLRPPEMAKSYPILVAGARRGEIVMKAEAADEAAEIWSGLVFLVALLGLLSLAIVSLIIMTARHTLRPLRQLVEGLDSLGRGEFAPLPDVEVAELAAIGAHFNRLSATLARSQADNRLLIDRLMSVQEAERKELARDLHDEFGASLFGIRAAASCIVEAASEKTVGPAQKREIVERARSVSALADAIQKQNYRILERIRPMVLRQMGLAEALRQLVETFRAQGHDIACAVEIAPVAAARRFDEEASLTAYRVAQEGLTNVARHSGATRARVVLDVAASPRGEEMRIAVEDDGEGPPPELRSGFGLLGMGERARKLDGRLVIGRSAFGGMRVEAFIPVERAEPPDHSPTPAEPNGAAAVHDDHNAQEASP